MLVLHSFISFSMIVFNQHQDSLTLFSQFYSCFMRVQICRHYSVLLTKCMFYYFLYFISVFFARSLSLSLSVNISCFQNWDIMLSPVNIDSVDQSVFLAIFHTNKFVSKYLFYV